jgi:hypothetical protein
VFAIGNGRQGPRSGALPEEKGSPVPMFPTAPAETLAAAGESGSSVLVLVGLGLLGLWLLSLLLHPFTTCGSCQGVPRS